MSLIRTAAIQCLNLFRNKINPFALKEKSPQENYLDNDEGKINEEHSGIDEEKNEVKDSFRPFKINLKNDLDQSTNEINLSEENCKIKSEYLLKKGLIYKEVNELRSRIILYIKKLPLSINESLIILDKLLKIEVDKNLEINLISFISLYNNQFNKLALIREVINIFNYSLQNFSETICSYEYVNISTNSNYFYLTIKIFNEFYDLIEIFHDSIVLFSNEAKNNLKPMIKAYTNLKIASDLYFDSDISVLIDFEYLFKIYEECLYNSMN
ncbi:hypothetical protein H311_03177 [Anncaliia algerae PRA109]|nr:hypothetical protein H311_03177 [Anncaliia algerae PRA109]